MDGSRSPEGPEEEAILPAGTRLGRYEIVRLLGTGGMGAVYEAIHVDIGKRVAVKTLAPGVSAIPGARQRFLREAQLTSRLHHPHVVDVTDMGAEGGTAFLVMELLDGEDLAHRLERSGPFAPRDLVDLLLPVCSALVAAHDAGIVHRDLKPQNVFLASGPNGVRPKVLDFGISKSSDAAGVSPLTSTGSIIGTPHYLAPEQIVDAHTASAASDQYALGVILYKCLANRNPFEGDSVFEILQAITTREAPPLRVWRNDLPPGLEAIVERTMSRMPWDRYGSVRDLGRALLPFASPRARVIWEQAFAPVADAPDAPEPPRDSHTVPMPAAEAPAARRAQALPASRSHVDSGTLSPAVNDRAAAAAEGSPRTRRLAMFGAALAGVALAGGGFLFLRSAPRAPVAEPPPPAKAAAPAPAPVALPPPVVVTPDASAPPPEIAPPAATSRPTAAPVPELPHPPPARRKRTALPPPAAAKPETPVSPPPRSLNPNGSPVID